MKFIPFTGILIILINTCRSTRDNGPRLSGTEMDDFNLATDEIIKKYGYPVETHRTETKDGYILTLHRIPHGKRSRNPGFPILVAHSLTFDSAIFLLHGEQSLGFFLADEGYDVWLINFRGNYYTRAHNYLSAKDSKFWDFSLHEHGVYDLPAHIDYICNYTKHRDLLYLGYSMGTTAFFIMGSERPEYHSKIRGAALLGPVAQALYSTAVMRFVQVPLSTVIQLVTQPHSVGEEFQNNPTFQEFIKFSCNSTVASRYFCEYAEFILSGVDTEEFDERAVLNLASHFSSTSSKVIGHYGQLFVSSKFHQYDYGLPKNMEIYRQPSPPEYHLESITVPMSLFVGVNDIFSTPRNVFEAFKGVHSVKGIFVAPQSTFNHFDFIVGKHAKETVYPEIGSRLREFITGVPPLENTSGVMDASVLK